jgi:hypothetical protein
MFGEGPGGFVLAGSPAELEGLAAEGRQAGVSMLVVGSAGGQRISIDAAEAGADVALEDAERAWRSLGERVEAALVA